MADAVSTNQPGPIGRVARILVGAFLAFYTAFLLFGWARAIARHVTLRQSAYTHFVEKQNLGLYLLAILAVWLLPIRTRHIRLIAAVILLVVALGLDYLLAGNWWGLPLAALLSLLVFAMFGFYAASHVLAGIIGNPG